MSRTIEDVSERVFSELELIVDSDVREGLRCRLVAPSRHLRNWDYGRSGERYVCWTIAEDPSNDTAIVYSEDGFGPDEPWGIVSLSHPWFGTDASWYLRLEDAFVGSSLAQDLSIWDVVAVSAEGQSNDIASSMTRAEASRMRDDLARGDSRIRYHVVYRSLPEDGIP